MRRPQFARDLLRVLRLPGVTVALSGGPDAAAAYGNFTARHPRLFFIQKKRWGVALLALPPSFEAYLHGTSRQALRSNRKRCLSLGYTFRTIDPNSHLEQILRINTSQKRRQGRDMDTPYVDREALHQYFSGERTTYGVLDSGSVLRAYACAPVYGEVFVLSRLLGEGDCLEQGIMYFLVSEIVREMIRERSQRGYPIWGMYDTYFGAQPGLRYFKDRLGFAPHNVKWVWRSPTVSA